MEKLNVTGTSDVDVNLHLTPGGSLQGLVFDEHGQRLSQARVRWKSESGIREQTQTDVEGYYEFPNLVGKGTLSVTYPDRCLEIRRDITVLEHQLISIPSIYLVRGATIMVRLTPSPDRTKKLTYSLSPREDSENKSTWGGVTFAADTVPLKNIRPGEYTLCVTLDGTAYKRLVHVSEDETLVNVELDTED
jgi:hypothetical protein